MDPDTLLLETEEAMKKNIDFMVQEFAGVRTGKASPALVESLDVKVPSYGSTMKLRDMALITTPEPRMLMVQPFDPSTAQDIERAIRESRLGLNPAVDGKIMRLPIPALSEERRKDLVKLTKGMAEEARVRVRGSRRDAMDALKKDSSVPEDDQRRLEKEVQVLTDAATKQIDEMFEAKEAEIMKV